MAIYLLGENGSHELHDDADVQAKLHAGSLSPQALGWREGMAEWRPLGEIFSVPAAGPHPVASNAPQQRTAAFPARQTQRRRFKYRKENAGRYYLRRGLQPWTALLEGMIGLCLVGSLAFGGLILSQLLSMAGTETGLDGAVPAAAAQTYAGQYALFESHPTGPEQAREYARQLVVPSLILAGVWMVTYMIWTAWVYRVSKNCRGFSPGLRFSSGMAAGSYYIPFVNLVYPFLAMQEIWRVSRDPRNWANEEGSTLVSFWWGMWIANGCVGVLTRAAVFANGPPNIYTLNTLLIVAEILRVVLCVAAFVMVHQIASNQKRLME